MSHQSGISVGSNLHQLFEKSKSGDIRLIKIVIQNEQLIADVTAAPAGSWQQDYDHLVMPCIKSSEPCYIFYRLDTCYAAGSFHWLFITYAPDTASVRQKMVYAASRIALKSEFGIKRIKDELFGTTPADISYDGLAQHILAQQAPKPLTEAEKELAVIKQNEDAMRKQATRQTMKSVAFPLSAKAVEKLRHLHAGKVNYVELSVNTAAEVIELESADNVRVDKLSSRISRDHARYNFYVFQRHTVFIYSMPEGNFPSKERMLYATCKGPLLEFAEKQIGLVIAKKFETDDLSEFTEEFLVDQLRLRGNGSGSAGHGVASSKKSAPVRSSNPFSW